MRLLFDKLRSCKLEMLTFGISPEKELLARFKEVRWPVKFEMEEGILPLNALFERSSIERLFHFEKFIGNGP